MRLRSPPPRRTRGSKPTAVILAAGLSSRFRGTKQLAMIGGATLVERAADAVPKRMVAETVVVVGHEGEAVAKTLGGRADTRVVVNPDYREGMSSSIRTGVLSVRGDCEAILVMLADQPFVTRRLLSRMLMTFKEEGRGAGKSTIIAAAHGDLVSAPAIFPRAYFGELSRLHGDQGAKSVIRRHPGSLVLERVRTGRALADIDTPEELEAARRLLEP